MYDYSRVFINMIVDVGSEQAVHSVQQLISTTS